MLYSKDTIICSGNSLLLARQFPDQQINSEDPPLSGLAQPSPIAALFLRIEFA